MRKSVYFVVLWSALVHGGMASAQDEQERAAARALAQEGAQLFEKDEFQAALDKFKLAYDKFPTPKLFLNIGQALRGLSRNVEALAAFERFLAEAKDASPEFIEHARAQVVELSGELARVLVESNRAGAEVTLDDEKRGITPLAEAIIVTPGVHKLTVTWEGESRSVEVATSAGQHVTQTIDFADKVLPPEPPPPVAPLPRPELAAPAPAVPAPAETPRLSRRTWYLIAGGAVATAVATTLIILYARSDRYPEADLGTRRLGDTQ